MARRRRQGSSASRWTRGNATKSMTSTRKALDTLGTLQWREERSVAPWRFEVAPAAMSQVLDHCHGEQGDHSFHGGTIDDCRQYLDDGDMSVVDEARNFQAKLNVYSRDVGRQFEAHSVVNGGAVSVPAALASHPLCFRRVRPVPAQRGIRLFCDLGGSGYFSATEMQKRGMAYIGLALALSRTRPVELYGCMAMLSCVIVIPMGLTPVDWSAAGAIFGQPSTYRVWGFNTIVGIAKGTADNSMGNVNQAYGDWIYGAAAREALDLDDGDVYFEAANSLRMSNPEQWVAQQIETINKKGAKS